jgi:hypothetical protein
MCSTFHVLSPVRQDTGEESQHETIMIFEPLRASYSEQPDALAVQLDADAVDDRGDLHNAPAGVEFFERHPGFVSKTLDFETDKQV